MEKKIHWSHGFIYKSYLAIHTHPHVLLLDVTSCKNSKHSLQSTMPHSFIPFATPFPAPAPLKRFLLTNRSPPINKTRASMPRSTARVTKALMTPATALDIPPVDEGLELALGELDVEFTLVVVLVQTPVVFPQAAHHCSWLPRAKSFMLDTKVDQGRERACWPKRG